MALEDHDVARLEALLRAHGVEEYAYMDKGFSEIGRRQDGLESNQKRIEEKVDGNTEAIKQVGQDVRRLDKEMAVHEARFPNSKPNGRRAFLEVVKIVGGIGAILALVVAAIVGLAKLVSSSG